MIPPVYLPDIDRLNLIRSVPLLKFVEVIRKSPISFVDFT